MRTQSAVLLAVAADISRIQSMARCDFSRLAFQVSRNDYDKIKEEFIRDEMESLRRNPFQRLPPLRMLTGMKICGMDIVPCSRVPDYFPITDTIHDYEDGG